jgi:hypothetical protein
MFSPRSLARGSLSGIVLVCSLTACASAPPPFVVALPNGYYLQRDRASQVALVSRSGRTLIQGPIAAYAVANNVVAGCVGEWPRREFGYPNETAYPDSPDCRYFILDTPAGRLETDLSPAAWRSKLKHYGAPESLRITAPVLPL